MRIGVLTSSRADYSIYLPLLKLLKADRKFDLNIIAFGTHLSEKHGYTIQNIVNDGFKVPYKIETLTRGDSPEDISFMIGQTITTFSRFWNKEKFDLVFCLGDRYEMFAAVSAALPFNIKMAHIHGGETTTGAIDNSFRHSMSHMSSLHFASTAEYKKNLESMLRHKKNIFNTGALMFDNLRTTTLPGKKDFAQKFGIDLNIPTILSTFHPETIATEKNKKNTSEFLLALSKLKNYQIVITMPNADTFGNSVRKQIQAFAAKRENIKMIESFGTVGYLSCIKHCSFLLGNTSSGFFEAGYFPKWVINIGDRQKGRILTPNIINCNINAGEILAAVKKIESGRNKIAKTTIYGNGHAAEKIVTIIKKSCK